LSQDRCRCCDDLRRRTDNSPKWALSPQRAHRSGNLSINKWGTSDRLAGLREDVAFALSSFRLSERTACKLLRVDRSSYRYEAKPDRNAELRAELVKLARQKPRFGYRRLHAVLERRGYEVNMKRIYRLYVEEGLAVRRRRRKRLVRERAAEPRLMRANQEWAMDFSAPCWRGG